MCSLSKEAFLSKAPSCVGDILYEHLQLLLSTLGPSQATPSLTEMYGTHLPLPLSHPSALYNPYFSNELYRHAQSATPTFTYQEATFFPPHTPTSFALPVAPPSFDPFFVGRGVEQPPCSVSSTLFFFSVLILV